MISILHMVSKLTNCVVSVPNELADASHEIISLSDVFNRENPRAEPLKVTKKEEAIGKIYPVSILGGTFDYLHPGHKILLSMAAWITTSKLIVGVTG